MFRNFVNTINLIFALTLAVFFLSDGLTIGWIIYLVVGIIALSIFLPWYGRYITRSK
ncbi:MAG: hypothetical protein UW58_C0004G0011 [Candidatus Collierbacteria bacterium GW2011_GWC2_44_30]|nr:MAG: hypothetical protein UW58_C0004G0011 [Candidatus Collierbacteria bacterium GW2011_GWC2_44_30]